MTTVKIGRGDVLIAIAFTAIACVDIGPDTVRSIPVGVLVTVGASLTLLVRRSFPSVPAMALSAASIGLGATTPGEFPPQTLVLPQLFAIYHLSTAVAGGAAVAAGVLTLGLTWLGHTVTPDGDAADFWPLVLWGVPWVAGRAVRRVTMSATRRVTEAESARDRAATEATSAERDRIARELHDIVAHSVSVMVLRAGGQRLRVSKTDPEAAEAFADIERCGRAALTELRAMLNVLRGGDVYAPLPGVEALDDLLAQIRQAGQEIRIEEYDLPQDLPAGIALAAYRVVQESLTNATRHGVGAVELSVQRDAVRLRIRVINRIGAGSPLGAGRGLLGLRERVRLHGGELTTHEHDGRWFVDASLPLSGTST